MSYFVQSQGYFIDTLSTLTLLSAWRMCSPLPRILRHASACRDHVAAPAFGTLEHVEASSDPSYTLLPISKLASMSNNGDAYSSMEER